MRALLPAVLLAIARCGDLRGSPPGEDPSQAAGAAALFEAVAPAIVGIEAWLPTAPDPLEPAAFGTGTIIHPDGLVLTSITVVPDDSRRIRARLQGGKTFDAEKVLSVPEKEIVLIRLSRPAGAAPRPFPFIRLGDSAALRIGQLAFALGNAFHSIDEDDQISMFAGAISGDYTLLEARDESRYIGEVLETTAAVNDGMDGGPLVDARGDVVGLLSLNFSRSRWLGTAIPADILKPIVARDLGWFGDRIEHPPACIGLELLEAAVAAPRGALRKDEDPRRVVVAKVDPGGPAARSGLEAGDRIVSWDRSPIAGVKEFRARFEKARPGDRLDLEIERGGARREVEITLWGRY